MATSNAVILRRWFEEIWNQGRDDLLPELASPDIVFHGTGGPQQDMHGIEAFRRFYHRIRGAFPDMHFAVEHVLEQGDLAALHWSAQMTHTGDHLGFPATGRDVTLTGMVFARFAGGKAVEAWDNWDMMGLMHAIGQTAHAEVVPLS